MTEVKNNLPRHFNKIYGILQGIHVGTLEIELPDTTRYNFKGKSRGPKGIIKILNSEFFTRLVREGENGFCESYLDGWWTTPDLMALMDWIQCIAFEIDWVGRTAA